MLVRRKYGDAESYVNVSFLHPQMRELQECQVWLPLWQEQGQPQPCLCLLRAWPSGEHDLRGTNASR